MLSLLKLKALNMIRESGFNLIIHTYLYVEFCVFWLFKRMNGHLFTS
jgi:hypothetical protein